MLYRRRRTATQHQLSARLRKRKIKRLPAELSLQGHHIAIVDDVVTTGSTVAEISHAFENGAATVQVWWPYLPDLADGRS